MPQYYYNPFGDNVDVNEAKKREIIFRERQRREKNELMLIGILMGAAVVGYLAVQGFASSILALGGLTTLYKTNPVFQSSFNILAVSFCSVVLPFGLMALANRKRYKYPVIPNRRISFAKCASWVSFGMAGCVVTNYFVSFIILFCKNIFGIQLKRSTPLELDSVFACVLEVVATAVIPAICEEFAMRCCSLQLLRKYGKGFAVFAVSVVFGLIHGNAIQFIFAFTVGLVLGLVTVKTDSILPAVLIHAFNNGMSVVRSVTEYAAGSKAAESMSVAVFLFWLAAGVISVVYLLFSGEFKLKHSEYRGVLTIPQKLFWFMFPGMIVPFGLLIYLTAFSIERI